MPAPSLAPLDVPTEESLQWQAAYRSPAYVQARLRKHQGKLHKLGVFAWPREARILDLCCGTGEVLRLLRAQGFRHLSGLDVTLDDALCQEKDFELTRGVGHALPYPDGCFDRVICMHSLHHLGGPEKVRATLAEAVRILKPGGTLALIDHYDSPLLRLALFLCRQAWFAWPTENLRAFRVQMIEEKAYLNTYLDDWPSLALFMRQKLGLDTVLNQRDRFFFYWAGHKPHA